MPNLDNNFLTSVSNVYAFDKDNDNLIFQARALSESSISIAMDSTEVRGGQGNGLRYIFHHSRSVELNLTSVSFDRNFLSSNVGSTIANAAQNVYKHECRTVDASDQITLSETPVNGTVISVVNPNGTISNYASTGSTTITLTGVNENDLVFVTYQYNDTVDRVTISATTEPSIVKLVMESIIRDVDGNTAYILSITIPNFQISGNYELSLTADGVSTEQITGMALQVPSTECGSDDVYAYADWIPQDVTTIPLAFIALTPSSITGAADTTHQLTTYGVRNGQYDNTILTSGVTYTVLSGGDPDITVSSAGLVTIAAGATSNDTATIQASYTDGTTTHTDTAIVTVS